MGRTWLPEGFPWGCVALLCLGDTLQQVNLLQVLGVPGGQLPRRPPASRTHLVAVVGPVGPLRGTSARSPAARGLLLAEGASVRLPWSCAGSVSFHCRFVHAAHTEVFPV